MLMAHGWPRAAGALVGGSAPTAGIATNTTETTLKTRMFDPHRHSDQARLTPRADCLPQWAQSVHFEFPLQHSLSLQSVPAGGGLLTMATRRRPTCLPENG